MNKEKYISYIYIYIYTYNSIYFICIPYQLCTLPSRLSSYFTVPIGQKVASYALSGNYISHHPPHAEAKPSSRCDGIKSSVARDEI